MTHAEFAAGYRNGTVRARVDPEHAARYISARLMLPFVMLPVLGAGVALALIGWIASGLTVILIGIVLPRLIKRSAPRFLLTRALEDEDFYHELVASEILALEEIGETHARNREKLGSA